MSEEDVAAETTNRINRTLRGTGLRE